MHNRDRPEHICTLHTTDTPWCVGVSPVLWVFPWCVGVCLVCGTHLHTRDAPTEPGTHLYIYTSDISIICTSETHLHNYSDLSSHQRHTHRIGDTPTHQGHNKHRDAPVVERHLWHVHEDFRACEKASSISSTGWRVELNRKCTTLCCRITSGAIANLVHKVQCKSLQEGGLSNIPCAVVTYLGPGAHKAPRDLLKFHQ